MIEGVTFQDDWLVEVDGRRWSGPAGSTCVARIPPDAAIGPDAPEVIARFRLAARSANLARCCRLRVTVNNRTCEDRVLFPADEHEVVVPLGPAPDTAATFGFHATEVDDPIWDVVSQPGPVAAGGAGRPAAVSLSALSIERGPAGDRHKRALIAAGRAMSESLFPEDVHKDAWANSGDLVRLITGAIAGHRPLSVVRIGDGEGRVLAYPLLLSEKESERDTIAYMFGAPAAAALHARFGPDGLAHGIATLRRLILGALAGADAVGLPTPVHFERYANAPDGPVKSAGINGMVGMAGALIASSKYIAHIPRDLLFDTYIFFALQHASKFDLLLRNADFVGIISHTDFRTEITRRFGIRQMSHVAIPGHKSFTAGRGLHFPDDYEAIVAQIEVPYRGAIFLVAAGYLGKLYCQVIKSRGGIAIDLGSVFDGWFQVGRHKDKVDPNLLLEPRR